MAVSLIAIGLIAQPVSAKTEPIRLAVSSPWNAHYADNSCRLARQFGQGDNQVTLIFNRFGPGDGFQLSLAGKLARKLYGAEKTHIRFGPTEQVQDVAIMEGTIGKNPALIFPTSMSVEAPDPAQAKQPLVNDGIPSPRLPPERIAAVNQVIIGRDGRTQLILETGSLGKAFAALSTCVDGLVGTWGIDPVADKKLRRRVIPVGDYTGWITTNDYPEDMWRAGQPAIVQVRLNIDATGTVTGCHIQETTRPKEFDDAVCGRLMKRAKFTPALDENGQPAASYWRNTVQFRMP